MKVTGGCHCKSVRFELELPDQVELWRCNCSICRVVAYLHCFVKHENFTLIRGEDMLTSYRFGSGEAEHLFCQKCGVKSFYQPRSHPGCWSVHFACIDSDNGISTSIIDFDGQNWEMAHNNNP